MVVDQWPQAWMFSLKEQALVTQRIEDALHLIGQLDPELLHTIRTIVGTFLLAKMKGYDGGSISTLMGAIWLALPPSRPVIDFAETIVHEFVHQCLFLEDMIHSIFLEGESRMSKSDALVTSAILRIQRGYDKAFHSAFVALALARFYDTLGLKTRANALLFPLSVTVPGLLANTRFLSAHGRTVLDEFVACYRGG
jgi:hypothetical protein